jgi:hypothetical protein
MGAMTDNQPQSPASRVMSEAIELAIAEKSPYPEASMFIDADTPYTEREIAEAFDKGLAAVVVSANGSVRIIPIEAAAS